MSGLRTWIHSESEIFARTYCAIILKKQESLKHGGPEVCDKVKYITECEHMSFNRNITGDRRTLTFG